MSMPTFDVGYAPPVHFASLEEDCIKPHGHWRVSFSTHLYRAQGGTDVE